MSESHTVLDFVDANYNAARENSMLPDVRTPQEGYGIMAERFLSVASSTSGTKRAVADALEALSEGDAETFIGTCDRVYSAAIQVASAALQMAIAMQNVVHQLALYEGQGAGVSPLESMAQSQPEENEEE